NMCAVALISFLLAWKYPLFWLVFLWSLWVMSKQTRATYYYQTTYQPTPPRTEPPRPRHTLYDLLEVSPNASPEVIKAAYRQLAMKYHPDKQPDARARQQAEERMKQINAAYDILSDPVRRAQYDREIGLSG
ncbi:MAG: DnaJ domain-containing protein, partial [Armatimonadota bacterium]|nr:DnaJ domain-containing protein [Armatimonadota bacterium]